MLITIELENKVYLYPFIPTFRVEIFTGMDCIPNVYEQAGVGGDNHTITLNNKTTKMVNN